MEWSYGSWGISQHLSNGLSYKTRVWEVRSGNRKVNCTIDYLFNTVSRSADLSSADLILEDTYRIVSTSLRFGGSLSESKQGDDTFWRTLGTDRCSTVSPETTGHLSRSVKNTLNF